MVCLFSIFSSSAPVVRFCSCIQPCKQTRRAREGRKEREKKEERVFFSCFSFPREAVRKKFSPFLSLCLSHCCSFSLRCRFWIASALARDPVCSFSLFTACKQKKEEEKRKGERESKAQRRRLQVEKKKSVYLGFPHFFSSSSNFISSSSLPPAATTHKATMAAALATRYVR